MNEQNGEVTLPNFSGTMLEIKQSAPQWIVLEKQIININQVVKFEIRENSISCLTNYSKFNIQTSNIDETWKALQQLLSAENNA